MSFLPTQLTSNFIVPASGYNSIQDLTYPILISTLFFIVFDLICVFILIPASWKKMHPSGQQYWSYYSSILFQSLLIVPLGFVVYYEHGSFNSLLNSVSWETHGSTSSIFAFVIIGYMIKDLYYCYPAPDLMLHHIAVVATNVWYIMEPGTPQAFFMFCTSILEIGSLSNNVIPLLEDQSFDVKIAANRINLVIFTVGHIVGCYWMYHLFMFSMAGFWGRLIVGPIEGVLIMGIRHYLSMKRYKDLQASKKMV